MKNTRYSIILLAALALAACKNDNSEKKIQPGDRVTVNFCVGSESTRTAFAEQTALGYYPVRWTDFDNVAVSLNGAGWQTLAAVPSESRATATFSGQFTAPSGSYRFYAVSPAAAVKDMNNTKGAWLLNIPWMQTPGVSTPDPKAIILGSSTSETQTLPDPVTFLFSHLTAYLRLTLTNVPASCGAVKAIDIASSQPFAGDWYYSLSDGVFSSREASRSLRLVTSSVEDQWITCAPVDMSGVDLVITVIGADGCVAKTAQMPSARQYVSGMVSTLTVDMSGATAATVFEGEASFLANTVPGFYPASGSSVAYNAGSQQLSRSYNGNSVSFSIITPSDGSVIVMSGIPADAAVGDLFTLSYSSLSNLGSVANHYDVAVVKEDGALLWLQTASGDRFIVKK